MVYIREAHPTDGRQVVANIRENILIADPKTLEERRKVAQEFAKQFKVSLPILVDTLDDRASRAYAAWPDRIYVIDAQGKIAYVGGPGPRGFRVEEVPPVLDRLLSGIPPPPASESPEPMGQVDLPPDMQERMDTLLSRMGLTEEIKPYILRAVWQKMEAYRAVMEARRMLMRAAQGEDARKALEAFREAQKQYVREVEKRDAELDRAIGYSKNPALEARLTAAGLIGVAPAPPFGDIRRGPGRALRRFEGPPGGF